MNLDGILPGSQGVEEKQEIKLPKLIPKEAVFVIRDTDDVDALPRRAIAHLPEWDAELALDLVVAGAGITLLSREAHTALADDEDFDPDGFGVMDEAGIWLPGLDVAYTPTAEGWALPDDVDAEE